MDLPAGRVIIELAPQFAPRTVQNIKKLVREGFFDNSWILRTQDNFVVQWGWPDGTPEPKTKAKKTIKAEFEFAPKLLSDFAPLPDPDSYAPTVGFSGGFPVGMDSKEDKAWLLHCYGTVAVGRDMGADSGNGGSLYAVIGQSPRALDRNITVVGRVVQGMELLSVMPRGPGPMGFYEKAEDRTPIKRIRLASQLPKSERIEFETMRTDSQDFKDLIAKNRKKDGWFIRSPDRINVCNMKVPVRVKQ
jgi:peptidylprolyl isomerase